MLRPLVSDLRPVPASYMETQGPAGGVEGQMPFLLFAKGVEIEIVLAFSTLESK